MQQLPFSTKSMKMLTPQRKQFGRYQKYKNQLKIVVRVTKASNLIFITHQIYEELGNPSRLAFYFDEETRAFGIANGDEQSPGETYSLTTAKKNSKRQDYNVTPYANVGRMFDVLGFTKEMHGGNYALVYDAVKIANIFCVDLNSKPARL